MEAHSIKHPAALNKNLQPHVISSLNLDRAQQPSQQIPTNSFFHSTTFPQTNSCTAYGSLQTINAPFPLVPAQLDSTWLPGFDARVRVGLGPETGTLLGFKTRGTGLKTWHQKTSFWSTRRRSHWFCHKRDSLTRTRSDSRVYFGAQSNTKPPQMLITSCLSFKVKTQLVSGIQHEAISCLHHHRLLDWRYCMFFNQSSSFFLQF